MTTDRIFFFPIAFLLEREQEKKIPGSWSSSASLVLADLGHIKSPPGGRDLSELSQNCNADLCLRSGGESASLLESVTVFNVFQAHGDRLML